MLLSLVYLAVRRLLRLLTAGSDRDDVAREVEILVLRHQLRVLSRGRRLPLQRPGSDPAGGGERAAPTRSVAVFPGLASDRTPLAPRAHKTQVELPK
jgi:hypothetical protein